MARRTVTILSDDLDGKESGDVQTVSFSYDGTPYESTCRRRTGPRSRR